ncbi:hypothetical protein [Sutcliffiella cohnii]|uniref:hypothetical protein n=1 Tax=Sutcliffiella cohnii TaxID=33932 RepID=UPI00082AA524|nr:hypothetical protein [Sutcliffiella cohnii]
MFGLDKILDIVKNVIVEIFDWFMSPLKDIHSFRDLIFGRDGTEEYIFKTFKENEILNVYVPGVSTTYAIAGVFVLIGIVIYGMKIASAGINPSNRTAAIDFLKDILIVGIVMFNLGTFYEIIFKVNGYLVDIFSQTEDSFSTLVSMVENNPLTGILGWLVIQLVLLGLALWANFYYMMRKLTLLILMIIGPLMVAFWLIPQYRAITVGWIKEFTGTVMIQAIHAMVFWIVASISMNQNNLIPSVILYVIFIPVSESIRGLFGLGGQMNGTLAKVGAGFGLASLAAMGGTIKGALGDKSLTGALKEAYQGVKNNKPTSDGTGTSGIGANTGTDTGTTTKAEKMLKAGQITSKAGKAVFGMAGVIAGSGLGPVGSIAGGSMGMIGGGAVGGLTGRVGVATAQGIGNRIKKGIEGAKTGANLKDTNEIDSLAETMAQKDTDNWISKNKDTLEKDLKKRFPHASERQLKDLFNKDVSQKHKAHKANALDTLKNIQQKDGMYANASDLAEQSANNLTKAWANENKDKEFTRMTQENPNITENEKIAKWDKAVGAKKQEFLQLANGTANSLSGGVPLNKSTISKNDFANQLTSNILENEKTRFKLENPGLSESEVDVKFNKIHGQQRQTYVSAINSATNSVKGQSLINKGHINSDHFASMVASSMTPQHKNGYVKGLMENGSTEEEAVAQWESVGKKRAYASSYNQVKQNLSDFNSKQVLMPNSNGNTIIQGISTASSGAVGFVKGFTGYNELTNFLSDTKVGKAAIQGAAALSSSVALGKISTQEAIAQSPTIASAGVAAIKGGANIVFGGLSSAGQQIAGELQKEHIPQDLIGRQQSFKNTIAYGSGVIGGVNGYQKGASFGIKHNPYNNLVQQEVAEVSEIAQMATKGSIQMVTTNGQSYIQMRDKTGKSQIVSRYGSGDASLKDGEVVYQDLSVQNGAIVPRMIDGSNSSTYMVDSGGGKIPLNRPINVNPNNLIANRNIPVQPPKDIQPYNYQVESGQYFVDDIVRNSQRQVRMVTERSRSYIVATDNNGVEHRISPYGQGDTRLNEGETIFADCKITNKRLTTERVYTVVEDGQKEIDFQTSIDPNELIPKKPNPRLEQRNDRDNMRHFQGV